MSALTVLFLCVVPILLGLQRADCTCDLSHESTDRRTTQSLGCSVRVGFKLSKDCLSSENPVKSIRVERKSWRAVSNPVCTITYTDGKCSAEGDCECESLQSGHFSVALDWRVFGRALLEVTAQLRDGPAVTTRASVDYLSACYPRKDKVWAPVTYPTFGSFRTYGFVRKPVTYRHYSLRRGQGFRWIWKVAAFFIFVVLVAVCHCIGKVCCGEPED